MPRKRTPATRAESKEATREALVSAALSLIAEKGLDAPSLDDICARAGYTRGAFYVHFEDRDALITVVMERVGHVFIDALVGSADDDLGTIAARFAAAFASGAYPLTRRGGVRPYQLLDACARSPAIRKRYVGLVNETVDRLAQATQRAQKKKHVRADIDAKAIGFLLVTAVIGVHTLIDLDVPVDLKRSAGALLQLLRR
jgi:TetR/AcrR family transcriptional regulator, transcriptional repressor for nem operon